MVLKKRSYSNLPIEIIFDILSRLPIKSLGLCRCVSKPWRTLLSQPSFIKTHLQLTKINSLESLAIFGCSDRGVDIYSASLNNAHHLFNKITLFPTKLSFSGYNPESRFYIYSSCDGLLFIRDVQNNKFVMNPVTRQLRKVPCFPLALHSDSCLYGFGYDSVSDDYKIVIISFRSTTWKLDIEETFVDVYSLKTGSWRSVEGCSYDYDGLHEAAGAFVGGCLHWLGYRTTDDEPTIVAFDLVNENFLEVPHPSLILDDDDEECDYELVVLGGCLCMSPNQYGGEVWVMKEYGVMESWTKFTLNNAHGWFACFLSGQEQAIVEGHHKRVMWNLKEGTLKEIVLNGLNASSDKIYVSGSFVESLVSPHGSIDLERE